MFLKDLLRPSELKSVALLADGFGNREIAEKLGTTEQVIKNYLHSVYEKLGITIGNKPVTLGSRFFVETMERQMAESGSVDHCRPSQKLSDLLDEEEILVAGYVADGLTDVQIAQVMTVGTVKVKCYYMRKIFKQLGFSKRIEVALRVHLERFYESQDPHDPLPDAGL